MMQLKVCRIPIFAILAMMFAGTVSIARADKEGGSFPFVSASPRGDCYFKLIPEGDKMGSGHGAMYLVGRDKDELLYTTEGWYAARIIVANTRQIARINYDGRTGKLATPPNTHIALGFYENGKLLKEYTVADLVPDTSKLLRSVSHYRFFKGEPRHYTRRLSEDEQKTMNTGNSHGHWVIAETVDGKQHAFNMYTGERCADPVRKEE